VREKTVSGTPSSASPAFSPFSTCVFVARSLTCTLLHKNGKGGQLFDLAAEREAISARLEKALTENNEIIAKEGSLADTREVKELPAFSVFMQERNAQRVQLFHRLFGADRLVGGEQQGVGSPRRRPAFARACR